MQPKLRASAMFVSNAVSAVAKIFGFCWAAFGFFGIAAIMYQQGTVSVVTLLLLVFVFVIPGFVVFGIGSNIRRNIPRKE